jgi:hypothetical protein
LLLACAVVVGGCGAEESESAPERTFPARTCFPPEEVGGALVTIEETVAFINALPKPLTVPCFLEALQRPLEIQATSGTFSLQPSFGRNNPRFLIQRDNMVLSVVPKGEGRPLMELSVEREPERSVKGEFHFPIAETVAPDAPYTRILDDNGTRCGFCHLNEVVADDITFATAYVSSKIEAKNYELVDAEYLDWLWRQCDTASDPDRCAMFDAIFAHGEVTVR